LTVSGPHPNAPGEMTTKLKTMLSMYDGSHFYRLMNVGGVFERMYDRAAVPLTLSGAATVIACFVFVGLVCRRKLAWTRAITFLIVAAILITVGVFALPDAVRIHHAVLVYPLPQLILAAVIVLLWKTRVQSRKLDYAIVTITALAVVDLLASELHSVVYTQKFIRLTGGRGRWSESFDTFCRENRDRTDLTIVSLDWGFNEQLIFLTEGPQLVEPFWRFGQSAPPLPTEPRYLFLVHPPEYSLFPFGAGYLKEAKAKGAEVDVRPYFDRQDRVAFYTIQFLRH